MVNHQVLRISATLWLPRLSRHQPPTEKTLHLGSSWIWLRYITLMCTACSYVTSNPLKCRELSFVLNSPSDAKYEWLSWHDSLKAIHSSNLIYLQLFIPKQVLTFVAAAATGRVNKERHLLPGKSQQQHITMGCMPVTQLQQRSLLQLIWMESSSLLKECLFQRAHYFAPRRRDNSARADGESDHQRTTHASYS